jgi:tetratricopeptide (TPR) repeat protein
MPKNLLQRLADVFRPGAAPVPVPSAGAAETARTLLAAGRAHLARRAWAQALDCFTQATQQAPGLAEAHMQRGTALRKLGDYPQAVAALEAAVSLDAAAAEPRYLLGLVRSELGEFEAARSVLLAATGRDPAHAAAWSCLGAACLALGDREAARAGFERAVALQPAHAASLSNLAHLEFQAGHVAAALSLAERAVASDPGLADAHCNLGMVLNGLGRFEEAIDACEAALRVAPAHAQARVNRGLARLALERYADGWGDYEARHALDAGLQRAARVYAMADWQGEPLAERTVLVYGEQGLGDEIMYASCVPELIACAGRVVLECSPRLAGLFARSFPQATVVGVPQLERTAAWLRERGLVPDCKVAVGSLPLHLRGTRESFAGHGGYLRADPVRRARWRARLAELGPGRTVGISWRGGVQRTGGAARSIELARWAPVLATAGVRFVSLQYGDSAAELAAAEAQLGTKVAHWAEAIADYEETAALAAELDLVLTVRTAAFHLAGALGRPVWTPVTAPPEWRFLHTGDAMRWYPSVRLFRQRTAGDWDPVIGSLAAALGAWARPDAC